MDRDQMSVRCPGAVLLGRGILPGHAFRIEGNGYATVDPDPDSEVHGVLWRLDGGHLESLDHYEGVPDGLYTRELYRIRFGGETVEAVLYVATDPKRGRPDPAYLGPILAAAEREGLPVRYRRLLEVWARVPAINGS